MGQGAKPGISGHLPGAKIVGDVSARMIPEGSDAISPAPHRYLLHRRPSACFLIKEAQKATKARHRQSAAVGAQHCHCVRHCTRGSADIIAIDGFRGGYGRNACASVITSASIELALAAVDQHACAKGIRNNVSLVVGGSIRSSADVIKAMRSGADVCYIGTAARGARLPHLCRSCQTA